MIDFSGDKSLPVDKAIELFNKQVEQAVHGYSLKAKTYMKQNGWTTSSGNLSKHLVRTMNKWFEDNKCYYPTLRVVWNRTYDMLQFTQRKTT